MTSFTASDLDDPSGRPFFPVFATLDVYMLSIQKNTCFYHSIQVYIRIYFLEIDLLEVYPHVSSLLSIHWSLVDKTNVLKIVGFPAHF